MLQCSSLSDPEWNNKQFDGAALILTIPLVRPQDKPPAAQRHTEHIPFKIWDKAKGLAELFQTLSCGFD